MIPIHWGRGIDLERLTNLDQERINWIRGRRITFIDPETMDPIITHIFHNDPILLIKKHWGFFGHHIDLGYWRFHNNQNTYYFNLIIREGE